MSHLNVGRGAYEKRKDAVLALTPLIRAVTQLGQQGATASRTKETHSRSLAQRLLLRPLVTIHSGTHPIAIHTKLKFKLGPGGNVLIKYL